MPARYRSNRAQVEARLEQGIRAALLRAGFIMQQEIKLQLNKGASPPASTPGTPPHLRTGQLHQSVQTDTTHARDRINPRVRIGPNIVQVPYARIHELGGTIRPKKGKFLRFKTYDGKWHTVRSVRMPKRPYIRPAVVLARPKILAQFHPKRLLAGR